MSEDKPFQPIRDILARESLAGEKVLTMHRSTVEGMLRLIDAKAVLEDELVTALEQIKAFAETQDNEPRDLPWKMVANTARDALAKAKAP